MVSSVDPLRRYFAMHSVFFGSPRRYTVRMLGGNCEIIVSAM